MPVTRRYKLCPDCGKNKPPSYFCIARKRPDGLAWSCKKCFSVYIKKYNLKARKTESYKKYKREFAFKYRKKNRHKARAHEAVSRAVRSGKLTRPKTCTLCPADTKIYAHHNSYDKPLEVQWVCINCHERIHHGNG